VYDKAGNQQCPTPPALQQPPPVSTETVHTEKVDDHASQTHGQGRDTPSTEFASVGSVGIPAAANTSTVSPVAPSKAGAGVGAATGAGAGGGTGGGAYEGRKEGENEGTREGEGGAAGTGSTGGELRVQNQLPSILSPGIFSQKACLYKDPLPPCLRRCRGPCQLMSLQYSS